MRRISREQLSDAIGTDAFLDIVANLVGILLILLMVIGIRMKDAAQSVSVVEPEPPVASIAPPTVEPVLPLLLAAVDIPDPDSAKLELARLKQSIFEADAEREKLERLMKLQKLDRDNLMVAVTRAERKLEQRRSELDETQREKVQLELAEKQANDQYASLMAQLESLKVAASQDKTEVLQHIATPMAKTVFVREEHFRLKEGRLLFVPLNEMTNALRREAPKKIWKLDRARQTTESIGPYEGFEMRYTLRRNRVPFRTESGVGGTREVVELDRFLMVPVGMTRGETIEEAMGQTSMFRSRLAAWNPRETIVTVWTYPDSFGEFRQLKAELHKLGFLTAARPLPENQLISGSPQGTRSAAQ